MVSLDDQKQLNFISKLKNPKIKQIERAGNWMYNRIVTNSLSC